jgi:hypothetical protein
MTSIKNSTSQKIATALVARGYQPAFDELPWKDEGANYNA